MFSATLSSRQIVNRLGELPGWSIYWEAKFDCNKLILSDDTFVDDRGFGIGGSLILKHKWQTLHLQESSIGICSVSRSIDKKYIEGLDIVIFLGGPELHEMATRLMTGSDFDRVTFMMNNLYTTDLEGESLPDGQWFVDLTGTGSGRHFAEVSSLSLQNNVGR